MNSNTWKSNAVKAWIAVAILVVIAIITAVSFKSSGSPKDETPTDAKSKAEIVKLLTVTSVTEKCATTTDQNVVKYDVGALKGVPPRKWSDALSTPLSGGLDKVKSTICHDPLYGVTVANMLAGLKVDGVSVVSLNPWLRPFTDASKINDRAAGFAPLLDVAHPSDAQVDKAIEKNHDYQQLANRVNTLLSRFTVSGTDTLRSVKNWHLMAAGLKVGGLPEVGLDSRSDVKPALILEVTLKNACAPVAQIGFNTGDKRPEVFKPPTCQTPGTPPSTTTCTSNCNPNPGCTSNCTPPTNPPTNPPTHTPCPCVDPTDVIQPVPNPDPGDPNAPSEEPSSQPTQPVDTDNPGDPNDGGNNGGSTQNPVVTGSPTPVDDGTHSTPIPTPTGGPFG